MTGKKQPLFPPIGESARLYPGKVMHARLKPFGHRFSYRVFTCLLDLDRLSETAADNAIFSVNRFNLVSFSEKDHIAPSSAALSLRAFVDELLMGAGVERPSRILLLAYPRIFGFVFNPISVYFCYRADGELSAAIYEVRNTFGERHTYVCKIEDGQLSAAGLRQERSKIFYVSPFIDMAARYHFRILPPGETVKIRIFETEGSDPLLSATFNGTARPFTTSKLLGQVARLPFMTIKVVAGIHWEAMKLWLKGAKFHSRGKPPVPVSYTDGHPNVAD